MKHEYRFLLTSPNGKINLQFKLKNIVALKINKIRYFQNSNNVEMLICFNGFAQKIQNTNNIYYTKSYELTYINTFGIDQSPNILNDYENLLNPQDINYLQYIIYIDHIMASNINISVANPLYLDIILFSDLVI